AAEPIDYTPPADPGPPPPPTTGGIKGKVRDEAGDPVPGVAVTIDTLGLSATTDVAGAYAFYDLDPADEVVVDFKEPDFANGSAGRHECAAAHGRRSAARELWHGGGLHRRRYRQGGEPGGGPAGAARVHDPAEPAGGGTAERRPVQLR